MSASLVNAVRFTWSYTDSHRYHNPGLSSPADMGVKMYGYPTYEGGTESNQFGLSAAGMFATAGSGERRSTHRLYGFSDDVTLVRGSHQFGVGANTRYWKFDTRSTSRTGGAWTIDGSSTGHALADFLAGRVARARDRRPQRPGYPQLVPGHVCAGRVARVEPGDDQRGRAVGAVLRPVRRERRDRDLRQENYDRGITSKVFLNAPPGLLYPGDEGFPDGKTGLNKQWDNIAPRVGVAWDVHGDGRLAVRSSYSMGYDFMAGEYHNINAGAPPFGSRCSSTIRRPHGQPLGHTPGGDPHPIIANANAEYIPFGAFGTMDPDINSPRVQQWNVTLERQLGTSWGVSATYLGSYSDRLWAQTALNNGVFLGLGPCTLNTSTGPRTFPVCSTTANLNQRRKMSLEDPIKSAKIGALDLNSDVGWQKYRGLKLAARHRTATGVSLNGTYTLSKCEGTDTATPSIRSAPATPIRTTRNSTPAPATRTARTWARSTRGTRPRRSVTGSCARLRRTGGSRAFSTRARGAGSTSPVASTARSLDHSRLSGPTWSAMTSTVQAKTPPTWNPGSRYYNYFNRAAFAHAGGGHPGQCDAQPRGRTGVLADRPGDFEARFRRRDAAAGAAGRVVQPVQPLQLG